MPLCAGGGAGALASVRRALYRGGMCREAQQAPRALRRPPTHLPRLPPCRSSAQRVAGSQCSCGERGGMISLRSGCCRHALGEGVKHTTGGGCMPMRTPVKAAQLTGCAAAGFIKVVQGCCAVALRVSKACVRDAWRGATARMRWAGDGTGGGWPHAAASGPRGGLRCCVPCIPHI